MTIFNRFMQDMRSSSVYTLLLCIVSIKCSLENNKTFIQLTIIVTMLLNVFIMQCNYLLTCFNSIHDWHINIHEYNSIQSIFTSTWFLKSFFVAIYRFKTINSIFNLQVFHYFSCHKCYGTDISETIINN